MNFINLPIAILLANSSAQATALDTDNELSKRCIILQESNTEKSLACNFTAQQIDDNTKLFIQNYIKENSIEKIISIEASWTEVGE